MVLGWTRLKWVLLISLFPSIVSAGGFSFHLAVNRGKIEVGACDQKPDFAVYLQKMNEILKPKNRECVYSGELTTTSRSIECFIINGPTEARFYWSETKEECEMIRKKVKDEA